MRTEHKDSLDITSPARTRNDGVWIVRFVLPVQMREPGWQVGEELFPAGKDDVVRRQYRKGPAPGAPARDEHTTGLCDERLAFGDARIAGCKLADIVIPIGKYSRQT